jgi:hypothetical protein
LLTPQTHAWKICVLVIALAIGFGVASFVLGLPGRSIYTGSLTNFGLMALGGLAVMKWKGLGWLAAPALLLYMLCPIIEWWLAPSQGVGFLLLFGSGILVAVLLSEIVANQSSLLVRSLEFSLTCPCRFPPVEVRVRPSEGRTDEASQVYGRADYWRAA